MIQWFIDAKRVQEAVNKMPAAIRYQYADALDRLSRKFLKIWKATRLKGPPGIFARPRGIFSQFHRQFINPSLHGGKIGIEIFTESKIAKQHEEGATISSPQGLAVPLRARKGEVFTRGGFEHGGVVKKSVRNMLGRKYTKRSKNRLVPIKFNGKVFLTKVRRGSDDVSPLFVIKKSFRLKPKLHFYATWDGMYREVNRVIGIHTERALKDAWA